MVRQDRHRRGVGRLLLLHRMADEAATVVVNTSQHTAGFFERFGFRTLSVRPDGFAPGLHHHHLELTVNDDRQAALTTAWEALAGLAAPLSNVQDTGGLTPRRSRFSGAPCKSDSKTA